MKNWRHSGGFLHGVMAVVLLMAGATLVSVRDPFADASLWVLLGTAGLLFFCIDWSKGGPL